MVSHWDLELIDYARLADLQDSGIHLFPSALVEITVMIFPSKFAFYVGAVNWTSFWCLHGKHFSSQAACLYSLLLSFLKITFYWGWNDSSVVPEYLLCLQRAWVQFSAHTWQLKTICNYSYRGSNAPFWPLWAPCISMVCISIGKSLIPIKSNKINL